MCNFKWPSIFRVTCPILTIPFKSLSDQTFRRYFSIYSGEIKCLETAQVNTSNEFFPAMQIKLSTSSFSKQSFKLDMPFYEWKVTWYYAYSPFKSCHCLLCPRALWMNMSTIIVGNMLGQVYTWYTRRAGTRPKGILELFRIKQRLVSYVRGAKFSIFSCDSVSMGKIGMPHPH